MLTLRITQKIARKLGVPLPPAIVPAGDPAADWCCRPFNVGHQRFILVANASTFLSFVLPARGMAKPPDFIMAVVGGVELYLAHAGHRAVFAQRILPELDAVAFSPVGNRSILGVMNDFVRMAPYHLEQDPLFVAADRLNEAPVGPIGYESPGRAFPPRRTQVKSTSQ